MGTRAVSDEHRGFRLSGGARLALALVVVAIAAFLSWSRGTQSGGADGALVGSKTPMPNAKSLNTWYATHLAYWTSGPFTDLNDLPRLTDTVSELVGNRFPGSEIDQALLVRDLATFLHALGSRDAAEYLERIRRLRRISADAHVDRNLHGFYRGFSGDPLPSTMNARSLLELFWVGDSGAVSHPRAMAGVAAMQVARSKSVPSEPSDPNVPLSVQIAPDYSMMQNFGELAPWIGPVWQELPKATRPTMELEEVVARHKSTLMCYAFFALRTADGEIVPVGVLLFFSPDDQVWQVEWFGSYYTSQLFWPF